MTKDTYLIARIQKLMAAQVHKTKELLMVYEMGIKLGDPAALREAQEAETKLRSFMVQAELANAAFIDQEPEPTKTA